MKKAFRIFLDTTPVIHFDFPSDVPLQQFVTALLISGYIMHETFYVPIASVKYILPIEIEGAITPFQPRVVN